MTDFALYSAGKSVVLFYAHFAPGAVERYLRNTGFDAVGRGISGGILIRQKGDGMKNIIDYTVVSDRDQESLKREVEQLMSQGWMLQGGVSVCSAGPEGSGAFLYAQAMTREEE